MHKGLGRIHAPDERDHFHPMQARLPATTTRTSRYWYDREAFLDQGNYGRCVSYSWTHWLNDGPVLRKGYHDDTFAYHLYGQAILLDEWTQNDNDKDTASFGTSVRAGAKALQTSGHISEYTWAFDLDSVITALLEKGPVVVGTNWYNTMSQVDSKGFIRVGAAGRIVGGHAYVLNGVNTGAEKVRVKNSWGTGWGINGRAWLSFADLDRLIREDGEACLALENK